MSYTITRTNGSVLATIADGTFNNTNTSLTLVGRNYANYGQIMTNNLVRLLENSSYNISPSNPLSGQLWYDSGASQLKVYTGTDWKIVGSCTSQASAPSTTVPGDLWWDSDDEQLYVYNGTSPYSSAGWILAGPGYPKLHKTGAVLEIVVDTFAQTHYILTIYVDNVRLAIVSKDSFTPNPAISGFTTIRAGYNLAEGYNLWGTANNASYLGDQPASNYLRRDVSNTALGNLKIANNDGITVGLSANLQISTNESDVSITNLTNGGNLGLYATVNTLTSRYLYINGLTGNVEVLAHPTTTYGIATKGYVDNKFINANLLGISTAVTAPAGTSNTMIATTEFVTSGLSGIYKYKIYDGNSHYWVTNSPSPAANLVIDGTLVMSAESSGVDLKNGATAVTQTQAYNDIGNSRVATTSYVKTATTWWGNASSRSAKWISTAAPEAGVNDIGSNNGDIWFQITS